MLYSEVSFIENITAKHLLGTKNEMVFFLFLAGFLVSGVSLYVF